MGRLVYISTPNYSDNNLCETDRRASEFFQHVASVVQECLYVNGIDAYIASSATKDEGSRYNESEIMGTDLYIQMNFDECPNVSYGKTDTESKEICILLAKNLTKIRKYFKYSKYTLECDCGSMDIPVGYVGFRNSTFLDSAYLMNHVDDIGKAIAKSICSYFGVKWNYRPCRVSENKFRIYIAPVNNIIRARTIASYLKKRYDIIAKVL